MVASFCYLGDTLSIGRGCELAVNTHVQMASKTFRELLPVLTSCQKLELEEIDLILGEIWLNYFGHVEHSSGAFGQHVIYKLMEGTGTRGAEMTWKQLTENDCHEWKLNVQLSIPWK